MTDIGADRELELLRKIEALVVERERLRAALKPLAAVGLWRDVYPDGPDVLCNKSLQRLFTPDDIRAARALSGHQQQRDKS